MNLTQLLITGFALAGILVVGVLAIIPSLLDYPPRWGRALPPMGRDQDDPDTPAPTPIHSRRRRKHDTPHDLAA